MSRAKKVVARILAGSSDANLAFDDLCFVLERAGFTRRTGKGSHTLFFKAGIEEILNLQPKGSQAKPYQVKQCGNSFSNTNWRSTDMRYELIIYWSRADECFVVEVPELAGCMADGATYQEAVAHAQLVIGQWLETARELGRPIPEPRGKLAYA